MSYQEKKSIVTLMSTLLIFGLYCLYVFNKYPEKVLSTQIDFGFWGAAFLILIPVSIAANIIIHIIFAIINKIVANEEDPGITDELDKLIELKSIRNAHWTFILGFFLAMGSQVIDMPPNILFITLIFMGFLAGIVGEVTKIYLYRRGV